MAVKNLLTTLGLDHNATGHWLWQRLTALLLIPLSYWLVKLFSLIANAPYQTTVDWLAAPLNILAMSAWIMIAFYHAALGIQVVLEDYVSNQTLQCWSIRIVNGIFGLLALVALAALLNISWAG